MVNRVLQSFVLCVASAILCFLQPASRGAMTLQDKSSDKQNKPGKGSVVESADVKKTPSQPASDKHIENMLDQTSEDSFPASDPPSWAANRKR